MAYTNLHTHTCSHTQVCTYELLQTYVRTSVHRAYTATCKYIDLYMCLMKEQNGHNIVVWTGMMQIMFKNCILMKSAEDDNNKIGTVERLGGARMCM